MAKIEQLIEAVEELDLRRELEREVKELKDRLEFGLVFERHIPESVLLADQSGLQDGEQVRFRTKPQDRAVWTVAGRKGKKVELQDPDGNTVTASVGDLLVVKGFNEPIYPSLVSVGNVRRGGNHAPHLAIESENFHALELLRFTHAGQFDCTRNGTITTVSRSRAPPAHRASLATRALRRSP